MTKKLATEPPPDNSSDSYSTNFWAKTTENGLFSTPSSYSLHRKKEHSFQNLLHPVDESPDFHDPYSNLSLFLSGKIKTEIQETKKNDNCEGGGTLQKWTIKLQEELIKKITPEFQKKFPQYRLGVTAVKKIWEKILFYTQQIQGKSEAIGPDGKLNINFFIQENLRQYFQQKALSFLNPYQFAHQIASKMSECIATLEGTKPKIDLLTQTVWSLQKHLLNTYPLAAFKTPYDEFDQVDSLIVKTILETTAKHPYIGMNELEHKTKEALQALEGLSKLSSAAQITCNVSAILAEKLYASSSFHILFFTEEKEAIGHFIKKHSSLYKNTITAPQLPDLVRRLTALYSLASHLPKTIDPSIFAEAIKASITNAIEKPALPQAVYAFISAELWLLKGITKEEEIVSIISEAYKHISPLPILGQEEKELLEIVIWKTLSESEGFLEKLPYRIGQKIEEEIAHTLIKDPLKSFSGIVQETVEFFRKAKDLTENKKWTESEKKIHLWCLQGDMLCRSISLNLDTPLAKIIENKWQREGVATHHFSFVNEICQEFLRKFPTTTIYMAELNSRTWTLYKYMWFTSFSQPNESTFDRFIKWHMFFFKTAEKNQDELLKKLEETCKKCLPLIPFDHKYVLSLVESLQESKYA